jgi:hypothetical protein
MSNVAGGNVDRLHDAGLIDRDQVPVEYTVVIEGLTSDEVDCLIKAKQILVSADANAPAGSGEHPTYFVPL